MKYLNFKLLILFAALALAIPPAWAETVTYTFTAKNWAANPENWTGTNDGNQFNTSANPKGVQVTTGKQGMTVTSPKTYNNVSQIVVTYSSTKSAVGSIEVKVGGTSIGSQSIGKSQTEVDLTYTVTNLSGAVSFIPRCTTNSFGINSITITYGESGDPTPQLEDVSLEFPEESYTAYLGHEFSALLTVDPVGAASEVVYSSSDENVATVASDGSITLVNVGTTTITASISDSETYKPTSASYTLTVKPNPDEVAYLDFTSVNYWTPPLPNGSTNKFVEETEFYDGRYTIKVAGSSGEGCYWLSSGKTLLIGKQGAYLQLPAFDKPVERIVIEGHSGASGYVTQNIYVGDDAVSTETTSAKVTQTYEIAPAYQAAGNIYTLRVTNANNTQIQKIYVYFKEQTGDPELSFNPASQTINEDGYTFKLHGENIGGNVGVYVVGDDPEYSNEFSFSLPHGNQQFSYFAPDNQGRINNEDVVVTYTGRALNAQGKIGAAWGDVKAFAEVDYKSDIYIVGDFGTGWDFTDGNRLMSESGGIYTYELNVENSNTFIVFARKVGEGVDFNTRYTFTPISEGNWEMNADEKEGSLNFYGAQPIHFQYPGLYAIEIDASDNTFTITRTLPQVAKPVISPNGGNFVVSQTVTIASETEGAAIYYTTDETEPSAQNGTLYEGEITLNSNTVIKAIAVKDGMRPSEVATATFTKTGLDNLAGVIALGGSKNFGFAGNVVVTHVGTYGSSKLIGLRDLSQNNANGTGGGVFYDTPSNVDLKAGDILAPGWSGRTSKYGANWIQITNATNVTTNGTATVMPFDRTGVTLTAANQSEYIILRDVTIDTQAKTATWTDGSTTVTYSLYNRYDGVTYDDGKYEYMICLVSAYAATPQVYPIELKKAQQDPNMSFAEQNVNATFGADFNEPALTKPEGVTVTYSSSDPTVAEVNATTGEVTIKKVGNATITATSAENQYYTSGTASYNIVVTAGTPTFAYSESTASAVYGTENPALPTLNNPNGLTVTYSSSNSAVATVNAQGEVAIVGAGTTTITATGAATGNYQGATATYTLTVTKAQAKVEYSDEAATATFGTEATLPTVATTPANLPLTYSSSHTDVATVDAQGVVSIVGIGQTTITAKFEGNGNYETAEDSYTLTVNAGTPTFAYSESTASAVYGTENPALPTLNNPYGLSVTYSSSNSAVATVNAQGEVAIVGAGTTVITATGAATGNYQGATATYTLTVTKAQATLAFAKGTINATIGGEVEANPLTNEANLTVAYSSSDTNVATVDATTGEVNIVGTGSAIITATGEENANYLGTTATYTINVAAADAITFTLNTDVMNYTVGDEVKVKVDNVQNAIGDYTITYKIGDTELVPDENGYVTIPTAEVGEVTLTVTVKDAYEHSTEATQNFVFNIAAADAITFTLTPDGGEYTVGDKVNVKVSNIQNTIGVYTITYTTNSTREPQTYDPEQGIDITSDEAGQVNLTVTVTDAYEHTAEGTKSAVYKFAAAPAIEITLNPDGGEYIVGDVVNVTVAVDKTLGDYTVVYQIDGGEAQNYDAATGIVITRSTVGNVDLTVTVTDGYEHEGDGTASATYVFKPVPVVAAPTFSLASGTYDTPQDVTITGPEGATIYYSVDGGLTWTEGNSRNMTETTILMAKAVKDGIESPVVTNAYVIKQTVERIPVEPIDGYFSIKNNGNNMFANVQGRKTLTFCDDVAKEAQAGTVIYVKTDEYGQVQSLRSQAADLQGYADRAMRYVPSIVEMIVNKLHATGAGEVLGETGYEAIMEKFNESFDHHLYVEKNDELGYRIYGKTPSMQPVVDFYAENKSKVDAKLPMLEGFINDAIDKVLNKTGGHGASILQHFSVHETWQRMGETLTEPVDSASTMAFYQQVLCNKDNVWSFAYETAMTYWERVKAHEDQYESLKEKLGEFAQYIDEIEQINPDFKYYIVQNNDKPDFISEGNGDIINNADRTYWTLVPRTTFKVNFPEANAFGGDDDTKYAVTLYTDFAYTVPEGVKAYAVDSISPRGTIQTVEITGIIPAQTPVMLISQSTGEKELTLSTASAAAVTENLLKGPDYLVDNYDLVTPQVQALFEFAKSVLGDDLYNNYLKEYEHLMMLNSGTVNNKYFWGLNEDDTWTCLEENADGVLDCVVRSLGVDQNGNFAFNTKEVRTNEAFLVDATLDAIKLYQEEIATPEFSLVPGSYTGNQTLEITCDTEGAEISYSLDGGDSWTNASEVTLTKDCTVMAKATKDGVESAVATAQYIIDQPTVITPIEPIDGYFKIMNNGNNKYANVQGRKTLTFTDAPDDQAGTVIYVKTNDKGQVQSLRSQAADLQGYADRAMNYVPQFVNLVVDKLNADGEGNLLGENGLGEIKEKFDSCFDHHLYIEEAEGGYRIYGKTPNMQDVVDFYRAHTEQVETKLPMLEDFINTALTKLREKIGGSSIFTPFSLHQIWHNMGGTLTEPTNEASTMAFYREVLNNKNYVWDFAYQTAMIYWTNVKSHPQYEEKLKPMLGEYADYIERIEDIHPDFKYYIVQNNDKPDFISEGNGDIINNAARTIWTLTPRDEFTVNIPEENMFGCPLHPMYGKTLYTDFAYTLPEGVKAYAVDSISPRGTIQTVEITGIIPAQTPVLLKAETFGDKVITISTTDGAAVAENLLKGPDYLIDEYKIVTPQVADMFSMAKDILGDDFYDSCLKDYEYLMYRNSGTVNNKYFWGLNEDDTWTCLEENADGVLDCVVRSLGIDDNGIFAFNKKEVRVNEAFMVTTAFDALNLYQKGDVNHDGSIDIDDITATIDRVLGKTPEGYFCTVCADVFEDNIIDIDDVTALIDIVLGK